MTHQGAVADTTGVDTAAGYRAELGDNDSPTRYNDVSTDNPSLGGRTTINVDAVAAHAMRSSLWLAGIVLIAVGVAAMLRAGAGMGSFDVVITGASTSTGVALWLTAIAVNAAAVAAAVALTRQMSAGTVAYIVGFGPLLAVTVAATEHVGGTDVAWLAGGIVCIAAGSAAGITANYGPSPLDALVCAVAATIDKPLWQTRIGLEVALTAAGATIGGIWGWGTLAAAVGIGAIFGVIHRGLEPVRVHIDTRQRTGTPT